MKQDPASARITTPFPDPPAPGEALEVAEGVLWIRIPLPMALDHVNVYALDDEDGWTIVDTGLSTGRTVALWEALLAGPLGGRPVTRLICTHHHPDHVGLAGWFIERGAALAMSRTAWLMTRMLVLDEQPAMTPEAETFYRRAGVAEAEIARRRTERPFNFADCVRPLPQGYDRLVEGGTIRMGGRDWDIRMGDGHAPEHATFWSRDDGLVIGGDQLLLSISPNLGVYPTEPGADPVGDWIAACERLAPHARKDQLVLGGHKLPYTGLPHRLAQMGENHHAALRRLLDWLDRPRTAQECFAPLFKREIGPAEHGLALAEAVAHVNHLHRQGLVSRTLDPDGAFRFRAV